MGEITYDQVKTVLTSSKVRGSVMHCAFTCPATGTVVESSAPIRKEEGGAMKKAARAGAERAKRGLFYRLRSQVVRAVAGAVGGGLAGSVAREAAMGATAGIGTGPSFSKAEKHAAVVDAFEKVKGRFAWDADAGAFHAVEGAGAAGSAFASRLAASPVTGKFEREVLARALVSLAAADGHLDEEETEFMASFVDEETGTVDEILEMGLPNAAEFQGIDDKAVRANVLMVAWALAMADEELDPAEAERLGTMAEEMDLSVEEAKQARADAMAYVFEQALDQAYEDGKRDPEFHAAAMELAGQIGMTPEEAQKADVAYRKRTGN
jgi:uncharacterized tellurite resistance protein B-like protein